MKSLQAQHSNLANVQQQLDILQHGAGHQLVTPLIPFQQKLQEAGLYPLKPTAITVFQINVGKMCNQVCTHCHVDAGPDRKEIMTLQTMESCLTVLKNNRSLQTGHRK
jgi:hypothetical protein